LGLALVVLAVAFLHAPWREIAIVAVAGVSLWRTPASVRRANGVTAYPMTEVAVLFFGIFLTMIPALELLRVRGGELGVREPWQFFWAAGTLSSFLDNAPTYLTFLALAQGLHLTDEVAGVTHAVLAAVSVGGGFAEIVRDHEMRHFYVAFYTMSAVCIACYLALLVGGVQLVRRRPWAAGLLVGVWIFELLYFFVVGALWRVTAISASVA